MASKVEKIEERIVIQEHSLEVDGTKLTEKKVVTTRCQEGSDTPFRTEKVHTRSIRDRVYSVIEVEENNDAAELTVTTSMTEEEVAAFMEEWDAKWKPSVNESVVAKDQVMQQPIQSVEDEGAVTHDNEDGRPEDQKAEESNVDAENMIQEKNN